VSHFAQLKRVYNDSFTEMITTPTPKIKGQKQMTVHVRFAYKQMTVHVRFAYKQMTVQVRFAYKQ
jgi:hypothetical protein